jgi:hypothetical protein
MRHRVDSKDSHAVVCQRLKIPELSSLSLLTEPHPSVPITDVEYSSLVKQLPPQAATHQEAQLSEDSESSAGSCVLSDSDAGDNISETSAEESDQAQPSVEHATPKALIIDATGERQEMSLGAVDIIPGGGSEQGLQLPLAMSRTTTTSADAVVGSNQKVQHQIPCSQPPATFGTSWTHAAEKGGPTTGKDPEERRRIAAAGGEKEFDHREEETTIYGTEQDVPLSGTISDTPFQTTAPPEDGSSYEPQQTSSPSKVLAENEQTLDDWTTYFLNYFGNGKFREMNFDDTCWDDPYDHV